MTYLIQIVRFRNTICVFFSEYAAVLNGVHCFIIDDLQFGGR